jgi:DNA-binding NarL/FixJ family response regulator
MHQPNLRILIFSSQDEEVYAMRYLKMGADGYLSKQSSNAIVETALMAMLSIGRFASDNVKEAMFLESITGARQKATPLKRYLTANCKLPTSSPKVFPQRNF